MLCAFQQLVPLHSRRQQNPSSRCSTSSKNMVGHEASHNCSWPVRGDELRKLHKLWARCPRSPETPMLEHGKSPLLRCDEAWRKLLGTEKQQWRKVARDKTRVKSARPDLMDTYTMEIQKVSADVTSPWGTADTEYPFATEFLEAAQQGYERFFSIACSCPHIQTTVSECYRSLTTGVSVPQSRLQVRCFRCRPALPSPLSRLGRQLGGIVVVRITEDLVSFLRRYT